MKHVIPKWGKCKSGVFNPVNRDKYIGGYPIIFRSSLELSFMDMCDKNSSILSWASETLIVPYISPKDGRQHRYYPDFTIKALNAQNEVENLIIEIKPDSQTRKPKPPKSKTPKTIYNYNNKLKDWMINESKWKAANKVAESKGSKFIIITEKWINNLN